MCPSGATYRELLLQWASTLKSNFSPLILYKVDVIIILSNVTISLHDIIPHLTLNNNYSLTHIKI